MKSLLPVILNAASRSCGTRWHLVSGAAASRSCHLALSAFVSMLLVAATVAVAQENQTPVQPSPLVRLLQSKGIITEQEAVLLRENGSSANGDQQLARLLIGKGIITREEYDEVIAAAGASSRAGEPLVNAVMRVAKAAPVEPEKAEREAPAASQAQSQPEGQVTTLSKIPVKLYGSILFNTSYLDRGSNNADIPLFAQRAGTSADQNHQNLTMTVRQTRFGLRYESKIFENANLTGVFEFDMLGGKPAFANGISFDILRLRLAYGRIDWKNDSLEVGQDWSVFSPLNPTTLASYAIPGFSTSGNLWNRIPQLRYEHRTSVAEKSRLIFTSAVLDPNAGDNAGNPAARVIGLGERGALPAFETRVGFAGPTHGRESSAGVSGHYSRLLGVPGNPAGTTRRSPIDSYGVGGDFNIWISSGFRITGEAFHGRALGIFSGNIAQSSVVIGGRAVGINSTGGWIEVHGEAPPMYDGAWKRFSANFGYGIEDNRNRDLTLGIRDRNQTYLINTQYKLSSNLTFALEYRQVLTDFFRQSFANQKLNWGNMAFLYSF